jgi:hypothetical protein
MLYEVVLACGVNWQIVLNWRQFGHCIWGERCNAFVQLWWPGTLNHMTNFLVKKSRVGLAIFQRQYQQFLQAFPLLLMQMRLHHYSFVAE